MADFNRYLTVADVLNGAAVECGLSPSSDPYSSSDSSFVQLRYLLTSCGRELIAKPWQQLRREYNQTVNHGGASSYALPPNFDRFIDQTQWDRTADEVLSGPVNPQEWQALKGAPIVVSPLTVTWRLDQDLIKIYPDPPATGADPYATIYFEYYSRAWVLSGVTYRDYISAGTDIVQYDATLAIKMLKLRFLGAKGFDTTDALQQYMEALTSALDKNVPGTTLTLVPGECVNPTPWTGAIANGLPP
jgi:hypothetical protein